MHTTRFVETSARDDEHLQDHFSPPVRGGIAHQLIDILGRAMDRQAADVLAAPLDLFRRQLQFPGRAAVQLKRVPHRRERHGARRCIIGYRLAATDLNESGGLSDPLADHAQVRISERWLIRGVRRIDRRLQSIDHLTVEAAAVPLGDLAEMAVELAWKSQA
jgi:hypothetical protein